MSVLVIDVGSSSARSLLMTDDLAVVPQSVARFSYQFTHEPLGAAEVDAHYLREGLEGCIDETLQFAKDDPVQAVGMACFASSLLGVDSSGRVISPVYTYADSRSADFVEGLRLGLDGEALRQRTGCPLHTAYYPAKLQGLRRSMKGQFALNHWMDFSTYLYRTWFQADVPMSYSIAAWTGMLDHNRLNWDAEMLDYLGLTAMNFPPLADYDSAQTGLSADYAMRWPQLAEVPFHLAVGDGAAANIGSGGNRADRVVLTVGTTAALRRVTETPPADMAKGLWKYRVDAHRYLLGGATSEGGNIFQWARDVLAFDAEKIEAFLSQAEPDVHQLTVLPLLAGERSPGYAPDAVGTLHGIRLSTGAEDILQALLESVALRLRKIAWLLGDMTGQTIYAGGGALIASPAWAQMICHAIGCDVCLVDEPEVTARGVASLVLGRSKEIANLRIVNRFKPDSAITAIYAEALQRQDVLYAKFYGAEEETGA